MHHYIHSFSSPTIKGWLLKKARTGFRKTWSRQYFVLESQQLRCYKNDQDDTSPISIFDLCEYQLQNQPSNKPFTFQLIHRSSKCSLVTPVSSTAPSSDLYLQAENEEEWTFWMDTLGEQQHYMSGASIYDYPCHEDEPQVDVLNKWLERYDLIVPSTDRFTPSLLSLAPSSAYANDDDESSDDSTIDLDKTTTPEHACPIIMDHQQSFLDVPSPSPMLKDSPSSSRFLGFLWATRTKKTSSPLGSGIH
ncbi:unnamed protein product [Absidia cylindrospora]